MKLPNLQAEHDAIRESNEEGNQPLSWAQSRNMPISSKVWNIHALSHGTINVYFASNSWNDRVSSFSGCVGEFENGEHYIFCL